jgi:putative membrane protein
VRRYSPQLRRVASRNALPKGTATPPISILLGSWSFQPVALAIAIVIAGAYGFGIVTVRRRGERWPLWNTLAFFLLGVGSYVVVNLGFLGTYSQQLRFAFSTRTALLLFVVPALIALGHPFSLAKRALTGKARERVERFLDSRAVRVLSSAMISPLIGLAIFSTFMTPISGVLRTSWIGQDAVTLLIPAFGLLLVVPLIESFGQRTSFFVTVEFFIAFVELVIDAIPGIVVRLSGSILDGVGALHGVHPGWFPSPIRDQQLSGDLLWFIAELGDIPVLILLFIRWSRVDRKEAKGFDDLSDEEMDALTQEHLRGRRE